MTIQANNIKREIPFKNIFHAGEKCLGKLGVLDFYVNLYLVFLTSALLVYSIQFLYEMFLQDCVNTVAL